MKWGTLLGFDIGVEKEMAKGVTRRSILAKAIPHG
jgi:hypothetical protein